MGYDYPDEEYPCEDCSKLETCDPFSARYCCDLCRYHGNRDCDKCKKYNRIKEALGRY